MKLSKNIFSLHNFRIALKSNASDILRLISRQFSFPSNFKHKLRPDFEINFTFHKLDYEKMPLSPRDCFQQFPIFQDQYLYSGKAHLDFGLRTIKLLIDVGRNTVEVYIAKTHGLSDDFLFDIIFFQPLKFILKFHQLFILHAACMAKREKAVLITGGSGCGKSILSLTLVKNGFKYLADDDVILKLGQKTIECWSMPTKPKLKKELFKYFPRIKTACLSKSIKKGKQSVDIGKVFPDCFKIRAIPKIIIFPEYRRVSKIDIRPLDKQEAVYSLMKEDFTIFKDKYQDIPRRHFALLSRLVNQSKVFRLYYQDSKLKQIPAVIDELLKGK